MLEDELHPSIFSNCKDLRMVKETYGNARVVLWSASQVGSSNSVLEVR